MSIVAVNETGGDGVETAEQDAIACTHLVEEISDSCTGVSLIA